jgi:hypothetical protein
MTPRPRLTAAEINQLTDNTIWFFQKYGQVPPALGLKCPIEDSVRAVLQLVGYWRDCEQYEEEQCEPEKKISQI